MPCRDDYPPGPTIHDQKVELEKMLCRACKLLDANEVDYSMYLDLSEWWYKHQEEDRKRIEAKKAEREKKKIRKAALEKLTPAERKALGL